MLYVRHLVALLIAPDLITIVRDNVETRTLTGASFTNTTGMTVESCVDFCDSQSFILAGLEFAQECCQLLDALFPDPC